MLTAAEREVIRQARDAHARATMPPNARPGHPSRFSGLGCKIVTSHGQEITRPCLADYERMRPSRPKILAALNG